VAAGAGWKSRKALISLKGTTKFVPTFPVPERARWRRFTSRFVIHGQAAREMVLPVQPTTRRAADLNWLDGWKAPGT
jgi:hypothetical protein